MNLLHVQLLCHVVSCFASLKPPSHTCYLWQACLTNCLQCWEVVPICCCDIGVLIFAPTGKNWRALHTSPVDTNQLHKSLLVLRWFHLWYLKCYHFHKPSPVVSINNIFSKHGFQIPKSIECIDPPGKCYEIVIIKSWGNPLISQILWKVIYIWANYNDLTATSLGMMVSKGDCPQMALIQVSEIL